MQCAPGDDFGGERHQDGRTTPGQIEIQIVLKQAQRAAMGKELDEFLIAEDPVPAQGCRQKNHQSNDEKQVEYQQRIQPQPAPTQRQQQHRNNGLGNEKSAPTERNNQAWQQQQHDNQHKTSAIVERIPLRPQIQQTEKHVRVEHGLMHKGN